MKFFFTLLKDVCFYSHLLCVYFAFLALSAVNTPLLTAETTMSAKYTQRRAFKKQLVDLYP